MHSAPGVAVTEEEETNRKGKNGKQDNVIPLNPGKRMVQTLPERQRLFNVIESEVRVHGVYGKPRDAGFTTG